MSRTAGETRGWVEEGTRLMLEATAGLTDEEVRRASTLPGWTVGQLVAHVAANAEALSNLASWAATGVETPMYPSVAARDAAIEAARSLDATEVLTLLTESTERLARGFDTLTPAQWEAEVTTIQGRTLPATEIPWLRAREVCVHAVDLARGVTFTHLPDGFLVALIEEIRAKRGLASLPDGPPAEVAAWLAGRPHHLTDAPALGPWL